MSKISGAVEESLKLLALSRNDLFDYRKYIELPNKKRDQFTKKVFCIGRYRVYIVKAEAKKKAEVVLETDLLSIKTIEVNGIDVQIILKDNPNSWSFRTDPQDQMEIASIVRGKLGNYFPDHYDSIIEFRVKDIKGLKPVIPIQRPCGNFALTYECVCNHQGSDSRLDLAWDIENLGAHSVKVLTFDEFDLPIQQYDVDAMLFALAYNKYFTGLHLTEHPIAGKPHKWILLGKVCGENNTLTHLKLTGIIIPEYMFLALSQHGKIPLLSVKFVGCTVDSKVVAAFGDWLAKCSGLTELELDGNGLDSKGLEGVITSMVSNADIAKNLNRLAIKNDKLGRKTGSLALVTFLGSPNNLEELDISFTVADLPEIFAGLDKGASKKFKTFIIDGNTMDKKRPDHAVFPYLEKTTTLTYFSMARTELGPVCIKSILQCLFANKLLRNFKLNLAGNNLGKQGAETIRAFLQPNEGMVSIDLSDNDFGEENLLMVCEALAGCTQLTELNFAGNFKAATKEAPLREQAAYALSGLLKTCPLKNVDISGRRGYSMGACLTTFLVGVTKNPTLTSLDISGNACGDEGILSLSKVLQLNNKIEYLKIDKNNITPKGLAWLKIGIIRNKSLMDVEFPCFDAMALESEKEKIKFNEIMREISDILKHRRATPKNPDLASRQLANVIFKLSKAGQSKSPEIAEIIAEASRLESVSRQLEQFMLEVISLFEKSLIEHSTSVRGLLQPTMKEALAEARQKIMTVAKSQIKTIPSGCMQDFEKVLEEAEAKHLSKMESDILNVKEYFSAVMNSLVLETMEAFYGAYTRHLAEILHTMSKPTSSPIQDRVLKESKSMIGLASDFPEDEGEGDLVLRNRGGSTLQKSAAGNDKLTTSIKSPRGIVSRTKTPRMARKVPGPMQQTILGLVNQTEEESLHSVFKYQALTRGDIEQITFPETEK